jgi:hypothetical protein
MPEVYPPPPAPERFVETRTFPELRGFGHALWDGRAIVAAGASGISRTCMIVADSVHCFGAPHAPGWAHRRSAPVQGTAGAVALDVSTGHGCAVLEDGSAVCWGENASGELGDGTTAGRNAAAPVRW